MIDAAAWGFLGASFLLFGAVLAFVTDIPDRVRGLILGFGAGTLFGAVAYELVGEAIASSMNGFSVAAGLGAGAIVFYLGSVGIDRLSSRTAASADAGGTDDGSSSSAATARLASRRRARDRGSAVVLGAVLDGIPESVVLGMSLLGGTGVSLAVLVAIAVSNIPEGLSASEDLARAGIGRARILALWAVVALGSGIAAGAGFLLLEDAPGSTIAFIESFTAGAVLAMLSESMIPEATEIGGRAVGLATVLGFAVAAFLSLST